MPLEEPTSESDATATSEQIAADKGGNGGNGLPTAVTSPEPPKPPAANNPTSDNPQKWYQDRKYMLELVAFLVLCAYTVFTFLQWRQIHRANELTQAVLEDNRDSFGKTIDKMQGQIDAINTGNALSKDALLTTQRAFLYVSKFNISPVGSVYKVSFVWSNGGTTPTRFMREATHIRLFKGEMPDDFKLRNTAENGTQMFVGPKADSAGKAIVLPAEDLGAVATHRGHLYIWGWAQYFDAFPDTKQHLTQFCTEVTDVVYSTSNTNIVTTTCQRGNCTDDECETH
jgi:hypothetical protein